MVKNVYQNAINTTNKFKVPVYVSLHQISHAVTQANTY